MCMCMCVCIVSISRRSIVTKQVLFTTALSAWPVDLGEYRMDNSVLNTSLSIQQLCNRQTATLDQL